MTPLTAREKEVLALLVNENASNKDLARQLGIGQRTAKFHVASLLRKHGVARRGDLAVVARKSSDIEWTEFARWGWAL